MFGLSKKSLPPEAETSNVDAILERISDVKKSVEQPRKEERKWVKTAKTLGTLGGSIHMKPEMKKYYSSGHMKTLTAPPKPSTMGKSPKITRPELYLPQIGTAKKDNLEEIYKTYMDGFPEDQIPVVTGLSPQEVSRGLQELRRRKLIEEG